MTTTPFGVLGNVAVTSSTGCEQLTSSVTCRSVVTPLKSPRMFTVVSAPSRAEPVTLGWLLAATVANLTVMACDDVFVATAPSKPRPEKSDIKKLVPGAPGDESPIPVLDPAASDAMTG